MATDAERLQEILRTLTSEQLRFVARRMHEASDAAAADALKMPRQTMYNWPNKQDVNDAVLLARRDGVSVAKEELRRLGTDAVQVLGETMKDKRNPRRQDAAGDVLDRIGLGKVTKVAPTDPSGEHEYRSADDITDEELVAVIALAGSGRTAGAAD